MNTQLRILIAVLLAGIVGTVVNAFAASIIVGPAKLDFLYVSNRYLIAIGVTVLLPLLNLFLSGHVWRLVSLAALILVPSLIAKQVLGVGAPWTMVLMLNGFYALAALVTYQILSGKRRLI
ncbi:MAG: hypothetical protein L3J67_08175 [Hyphomicrobiaceae bacterium]|nr:hypothetical protein [Hyphomicrobiaceae bacterium]